MKEQLIIIGASGHGKVVADIAIKMNRWEEIGFLDDDEFLDECLGLKVLGKSSDAYKYKEAAEFFVAIGNNDTREKLQEKLIKEGLEIATLIHPNAEIASEVEIGIGTAIMAGVVINPSTKIGKGCIINTSSSIDHDNIIEDYVHISPGVNLAGTVYVGKGSWLGIGSVVNNNINICSKTIIGAGSVLINNTYSGGVYLGVPAKKI